MGLSTEDEYFDSLAVQSALDSQPNAAEPRLSQIDEVSAEIIKRLLYRYEVQLDKTTGVKYKVPVNCNYPDIENALGYALAHHNLLMNLSWEESRSLLMDWWGIQYQPLKTEYKRDKNALQLLRTINNVFVRNIIGGSAGGSHQDFIVKQMGANREVTVRRPKE